LVVDDVTFTVMVTGSPLISSRATVAVQSTEAGGAVVVVVGSTVVVVKWRHRGRRRRRTVVVVGRRSGTRHGERAGSRSRSREHAHGRGEDSTIAVCDPVPRRRHGPRRGERSVIGCERLVVHTWKRSSTHCLGSHPRSTRTSSSATVTFTVKVTGVPRDTDVELTEAVAVHTVAALAAGATAGRNRPNEAMTVVKATARTREAGRIILVVGRRTTRLNRLLNHLSKILRFVWFRQTSGKSSSFRHGCHGIDTVIHPSQ
jgi:hypothetical protein